MDTTNRRLLYVASTHSHIVNFHRPYLKHYKDYGYVVDVACGGTSMDIPEADHVFQIPFAKSITSLRNIQVLFQLRRLIHKNRYDLILVHTSLAAFFTRAALWGVQKRPYLINTVHGYLFTTPPHTFRDKLLLAAERITKKQTDLLMTMNQVDFELAKKYRLAEHIRKIPGMGVDFSRLQAQITRSREQIRLDLGIQPDEIMLLYAAEFSKRKNQAMLIRAISQVDQKIKVFLPGYGDLLDECQTLAKELAVDDRVLFPGHVSAIAEYCLAADVGISVSRSEGLPFNLLECMLFSQPIIATNTRGHADLVTHNHNGFLVSLEDESELIHSIAQLAGNPSLRRRMGLASVEAAQEYRLEHVMPKVLDIWHISDR